MTGIKLLILTLLSVNVVQQVTAACSQPQLNTCQSALTIALGFDIAESMPVPYIMEASLDTACTGFAAYATCLDVCRADDPIKVRFSYEPYEAIGNYICHSKDAYTDLSGVIGDNARQTEWKTCFNASEIVTYMGSEAADAVCRKLDTFTNCCADVAKEDNSTVASDYIRDMASSALKVYYTHYKCGSAAAAVELNRWLCVLGLLFYLLQRVV